MKNTLIIEISCENLDRGKLNYCGEVLKGGGTVVFPTETVYGLGANAIYEKAVEKIFKAKGRPSDNPLIVHVTGEEDVIPLVKAIPPKAKEVMDAFWPGPLTIIMEKSSRVPYNVTAGLNTVAIRYPAHPIAKALIEAAGVPIAAPSANISGKPSPTKASHVIDDLDGRVDVIIAGGDCSVGLESTVLDMTTDIPTILRPGGVTKEELEGVLGRVEMDPSLLTGVLDISPKSPGMKYTHYSPKAEVVVYAGEDESVVKAISNKANELMANGKEVGIICTNETQHRYKKGIIKPLGSKKDMKTIAAKLFSTLREFDETKVDIILAEALEEVELGQAIMNRLVKAAGYKIYRV
ncbi:L-threonylcarbamoyladenylate synthase [Alkaliphilus serpentinus]|uniref:Threonylcarbamoyl-AMP synthase n=1 Tax=Alkaliphilus serpentinus TaxID=1482731 RepID=A0A833HPK0_9FIRM|nr:L-threonylcarbamoyladenylate synthase [Alkaliphilus serpentinus]KAB3530884.1 threonylcarbamoyl-AMP synthase [Alkaliphilus serpentinus]